MFSSPQRIYKYTTNSNVIQRTGRRRKDRGMGTGVVKREKAWRGEGKDRERGEK